MQARPSRQGPNNLTPDGIDDAWAHAVHPPPWPNRTPLCCITLGIYSSICRHLAKYRLGGWSFPGPTRGKGVELAHDRQRMRGWEVVKWGKKEFTSYISMNRGCVGRDRDGHIRATHHIRGFIWHWVPRNPFGSFYSAGGVEVWTDDREIVSENFTRCGLRNDVCQFSLISWYR